MVSSRCIKAIASLSLAALLFLLGACDPPGKPKAEEPQNEDREAITDFKVLYESNCAGCHGSDGKNGAARTLNQPLYLAILPRDTLRNILVYGRPGTAMPAWSKAQGGPLTDAQIDALVNGIYANWAKPAQFGHASLLPYGSAATGDAAHGKRLFLRACFLCHGRGAAVGPVTDRTYASLASNAYIRSAILAGRPDFGMPDYRILNLGHPLSGSDVDDLVAYVASYRPPEITARMNSAANGSLPGGQQTGVSGPHENESGTGDSGNSGAKGNEGSGNGPGSPRPPQRQEGNKGKGSSSQGGVK